MLTWCAIELLLTLSPGLTLEQSLKGAANLLALYKDSRSTKLNNVSDRRVQHLQTSLGYQMACIIGIVPDPKKDLELREEHAAAMEC